MVVIYFWLISFRLPPGAQYVKCRAQRCTEGSRLYLFPGHVDTNSLVVQDEYVFTQVCVVIHYLFLLHHRTQQLLSLWNFLCFYYIFLFGLLCFMLFHQNPHNGFPQHTCSPLARCVFWLCFVSFMCLVLSVLTFHTDTLHALKNVFASWDLTAKRTVNRQVGVLITIRSDFDSN